VAVVLCRERRPRRARRAAEGWPPLQAPLFWGASAVLRPRRDAAAPGCGRAAALLGLAPLLAVPCQRGAPPPGLPPGPGPATMRDRPLHPLPVPPAPSSCHPTRPKKPNQKRVTSLLPPAIGGHPKQSICPGGGPGMGNTWDGEHVWSAPPQVFPEVGTGCAPTLAWRGATLAAQPPPTALRRGSIGLRSCGKHT
jgi:hypothetical protein